MTPIGNRSDSGRDSGGQISSEQERNSAGHQALRREISDLGRLFGVVIRRFAGEANFTLVEKVRQLSAALRAGSTSATTELKQVLADLNEHQLKIVIRSFTMFLELANLAEDRHRIRVLRARDLDHLPRSESVGAAIRELHGLGLTANKVQSLVDRVGIELVLTAHPTEAKRRSVRRLLKMIQDVLSQTDALPDNRRHRVRLRRRLIGLLEILWHTDLIRPWRPTVLQEVERGLAFLPVIWAEGAAVAHDLREALHAYYPSVQPGTRPLIAFGSWIGGDRDGNPFVTTDVTEQTLILLRRHAIEAHRKKCHKLIQALSVSDRQTSSYAPLHAAVQRVAATFPEAARLVESQPPLESCRRWLHLIDWRLAGASAVALDSADADAAGAYTSAEDLLEDVQLLRDALRSAGCRYFLKNEIEPWLDQIRIFGFHAARLDIRQHASVYKNAFNEIWKKIGFHQAPESISERDRMDLLMKSLKFRFRRKFQWSTDTAEVLALFRLLRRVGRRFGMAALGGHVISMTAFASDVLSVLVLWRWSEIFDGHHPQDCDLRLPIVPLFETINDLHAGASTLRAMLKNTEYRAHLRGLGNRQTVMIGYSDSTKDGGYLAAQWALYESQIELQHVAEEFGVTLTLFHGRGGALGRGGGPAARNILSLPRESFSGSMRLTEQGEVLAERYDNADIAHRHFEQLLWSLFVAAARQSEPIAPDCVLMMKLLAREAWTAYRKLVEHPAFGDYYRLVTPIGLIEQLPIGSRPAKRKSGGRIEDLRAIPWVFSWTQNRCLLPAWFGIGSAYDAVARHQPAQKKVLVKAYREWQFFKGMIDNAALALAKANVHVFRQYCRLADSSETSNDLTTIIIDEYWRTCDAVLEITGCRELLDDVPWLQKSIRLRNGYVDPLNLIQVELMSRLRDLAAQREDTSTKELEHLASLTVKGIATGMRTTG